MQSRFILQSFVTLAVLMSLHIVAVAQRDSRAQSRAYPPGPCHQNTRVCVRNMNKQIGMLRAYVQHLKPGEKVIFNPQPDPPGIPPLYRNAIQAYRALGSELSDLSSNSAEIAGLKGSPEKISSAQDTIREARGKLDGLENPTEDRASINSALNELGASVQRLSKTIGGW